ncbi:MAG: DNA polymerase III subunit gamma/tau [Candidatus Coprenecus sp.]
MEEKEQFIVSARKYRPDTFDSLVGQENIATTLRNSILRGQLAHAYLFCGPRGVGKTTTARIFAKSINCLNPSEDMQPCGVCESCVSFAQGRSYCIHELDAASNNSVDDIRNLTEIVRIPPQVGKYSVFIIDEVHMLSSAAFNAFLKTLEEPPSHAIFILATTEKHKILPTILSRCQTYDFNRIAVPDIVSNLRDIANKEGVTIGDDSLHVIAIKGDGSMRDSLTLFDQTVAFCGKDVRYEEVTRNLNILDYDYYFRIVDNSLKGDYISSLLVLDEVLSKGFNENYFISGLSSHLRDLIVCRNKAAGALLDIAPSLVERYVEQASRASLSFIYNSLKITTACESGFKQSSNRRLHIEFALMRLCEHAAFTDTYAVIDKDSTSSVAGDGNRSGIRQGENQGGFFTGGAVRKESNSAVPIAGQPTGQMTGQVTGNEVGQMAGQVAGNVAGNMVGQMSGNVSGQVAGNMSGNVSDQVTGNVAGQMSGQVAGNMAGNETGNEAGNETGQVNGNVAGHMAGQGVGDAVGQVESKLQVREGGTQVAEDDSAGHGRKGDSGSNKGFSLKAMRDRAIKSQQSVEPTVNIVDKELVVQEMEQAWEWLAAQEKAAGRVSLAAYMTHKKPMFDTASGKIVFEVGNRTQKEWIENKARVRMETELRLKLSNSTLTLEIEVHQADEEEKKEMMYMPEDKAKFLLSNNEELRELKKDFGLEVK